MKRNILFQGNNRWERIGVVENEKLIYYEEKFINKDCNKGDVFIGKITRVDSALNAVFVDIGLNKCGFLPLKFIHPKFFKTSNEKKIIIEKIKNKSNNNKKISVNIQELIKKNTYIHVQVIRPCCENKGPLLSNCISLQCKNLKLILNSFEEKIIFDSSYSKKEQKEIGLALKNIKNCSVILNKKIKDHSDLLEEINIIAEKIKINSKIGLLFKDNDLLIKCLHNSNFSDIKEIIIENSIKKIEDLLQGYHFKNIIINKSRNVFQCVEEQIDSFQSKIVQLKSGGYLIFENTSSGWMVDVNMGNSTTNLQTNLEAAEEIYRQIQCRNIGGLINIDFIDMDIEHNIQVEKKIQNYINQDFVKSSMSPINSFFCLQISRQYSNYTRSSICKNCDSYVESIENLSERLIQKIYYVAKNYKKIDIHLSKEIAEYFLSVASKDFYSISSSLNLNFKIIDNVSSNYFKIETF